MNPLRRPKPPRWISASLGRQPADEPPASPPPVPAHQPPKASANPPSSARSRSAPPPRPPGLIVASELPETRATQATAPEPVASTTRASDKTPPPPAHPSALPPSLTASPAPSRWLRWRLSRATPPSTAAEHRHLTPDDLRFLTSVQEAQVLDARPWAHASLWLMLAVVLLAGTWAALTQVEQITRADARVVPDGHEQVIASLEGGILRELMVSEGAQVHAGQPLLRLDPTRFESQQQEGDAKRLALKASIARLQAETTGQPLHFSADVAAQTRLTRSETDAYLTRQRGMAEALSANQHSITLVQRELAMAENMAAKGLMSEVEVMRLKRQIGEMQQQSAERRSRFKQDAGAELLRAQAELAQLEEQMVARDDQVRRTVIESPVDGLVKTIRVNTLGGVVNPGAPIMEILPVGTRLWVEARIKPADIGFVHVGQAAEVKLSAYDYSLYGGLHGTVDAISPDALGDAERANGAGDTTWYRALVRIDGTTLAPPHQNRQVLPGMTGSVEINTGQRSVLDFVLRPLLKVQDAFRER